MFVFNRSVFAVLAPLALLLAVVLFSNVEMAAPAVKGQADTPAATQERVANVGPSRKTAG